MSLTEECGPIRAVVTGGAGFIGRWVTAELLGRGHAVRVFDDCSSGAAANLAEFKGHPGFEGLIVGDVKNPDQVEAILHDDFDVCYHLAAGINVQASIDDPRTTMQNDIIGTFNILETARRRATTVIRNPRVVVVSTCMVYAPCQFPAAINEDHAVRALSPYAACKLAGEHLGLCYYHSYGLPVTVLRPFNTYGPYQKTDQEGGVVAVFLRRALRGEPLLVKGDGHQTRDLLYVKDCARFIVLAGLTPATDGMILNAGLGRDISIRALADKIAAGRCEVRHAPHDHPQAEVTRLLCDNARAARVLGWKPAYDLDVGLAETEEWIAKFSRDSQSSAVHLTS